MRSAFISRLHLCVTANCPIVEVPTSLVLGQVFQCEDVLRPDDDRLPPNKKRVCRRIPSTIRHGREPIGWRLNSSNTAITQHGVEVIGTKADYEAMNMAERASCYSCDKELRVHNYGGKGTWSFWCWRQCFSYKTTSQSSFFTYSPYFS